MVKETPCIHCKENAVEIAALKKQVRVSGTINRLRK